MKYFTISVVMSFMALLPFSSAEPKCHMKELASCVDIPINFINSLEKKTLVSTNEDMDRFCKTTSETFACFRDYAKRCMTIIQTEIAYLAVDGIAELNKQLCESNTSPMKEEFLVHVECLNQIAQSEDTSNSLQYFFAILEHFVSLSNVQRFNYMCCGYAKMFNAIRTNALNTCGEETTKAGEEFISLAIAELPSLLCTGYDAESEGCKAVLPESGSKPTEGFKQNPIYKFAFRILKNYVE